MICFVKTDTETATIVFKHKSILIRKYNAISRIKCNMDNKSQSLKCERRFSENYLHQQALQFICIEEPDGVNSFTKSFVHILNFEFYCPY